MSVLYKHIIQVENKNVGLKVGGGTNILLPPPYQKSGGGTCPPCPPPLPTPVIIIIIITTIIIITIIIIIMMMTMIMMTVLNILFFKYRLPSSTNCLGRFMISNDDVIVILYVNSALVNRARFR